MATPIRVVGVPVERWRESAARLYGGVSLSRLLWRTETAAYAALLHEGAEFEVVEFASGMACGLQEYAEQRSEEEK